MVNYFHISPSRGVIYKIHATIMQVLYNLMVFLGKESHQFPSSLTMVNSVSI